MAFQWKKYSFFVLIVVIIVAVALYYHYRHHPAPVKAAPPPVQIVKMVQVQQMLWPEIIDGTGNVSAEKGVMVLAQAAGQVTHQYIKKSQKVAAGQPLYQIDPRGLAQLVAQNKAQARLKEQQLLEQEALFKKKYASKNAYDIAKEAYQVALKTLDQNKRKLELTKVVAPFAGHVGVPLVHTGDFVSVNDALVSLQDNEHLRVDFTISGIDALKARVGQKVEFAVNQYPDKKFHAVVTSVNTSINKQSQSILIRAHIEKSNLVLLPGTFAEIHLYIHSDQKVLTVPQTAIVYSMAGAAVYVVHNNIAHLVPVTLGERHGERIAIEHGVKLGDVIVSEGQVKLMDGSHVKETQLENI